MDQLAWSMQQRTDLLVGFIIIIVGGWVDVYDACVSAGSCVSLHTCKGQMTTVRSWFFPSTMGSGD